MIEFGLSKLILLEYKFFVRQFWKILNGANILYIESASLFPTTCIFLYLRGKIILTQLVPVKASLIFSLHILCQKKDFSPLHKMVPVRNDLAGLMSLFE